MNIKLKTLTITDYNDLDKRKIRFIKDISNDPLVNHFVESKKEMLIKNIEDSKNSDNLMVGPVYIIAEKKKLIGFIRLATLNEIGLLDLHYGVHPNYRHQGYGSRILKEVGNYLLNKKEIKKIKLDIKDINKNSIKCAEHANFKLERMISYGYSDIKVLVYTKGR